MARAQTWSRNISKKIKQAGKPADRNIINDKVLESIKRRAEDVGLIIHAVSKRSQKKEKGRKG